MASYPRQLITSLCSLLNQRLVDFFSLEQHKFFQNYKDLNTLVSETLWDYIKTETQKTEINAIYNTQVKMRRQKKKRWMKTYLSCCEKYSLQEKKNPYHSVLNDYKQFLGEIFQKIYNAPDVESAIENYKVSMKVWQENDKTLLIDYPLLNTKTVNQVKTSYKTDLIINLIEIILESYDGNIESYFSKKPAILLDKPLFSPSKFSVDVSIEDSLGSYMANLVDIDSEDILFRVFVNIDKDTEAINKFKVFDAKDNQLLMTLFNRIDLEFYENKQILIEVGALAKSINSRPSQRLYDDVQKRIHNMALTRFQLYKKSNPKVPVSTFSFFENVNNIERDGKKYLQITFGEALYESITKKKMISVTSSNYNSLEREMSKLLYHNLQKERIALSITPILDADGYLYKKYKYSYFQRIILFKKKKKADNIQLISETLQEFVDKKIALAKYYYDKESGLFHLYYYPLSDDEKADLINVGDLPHDELPQSYTNSLIDNTDTGIQANLNFED